MKIIFYKEKVQKNLSFSTALALPWQELSNFLHLGKCRGKSHFNTQLLIVWSFFYYLNDYNFDNVSKFTCSWLYENKSLEISTLFIIDFCLMKLSSQEHVSFVFIVCIVLILVCDTRHNYYPVSITTSCKLYILDIKQHPFTKNHLELLILVVFIYSQSVIVILETKNSK